MPIQVVFKAGNFYPAVYCDGCGERIEDAKDGNYQFDLPAGQDDGATVPVYFTHKGCCHAFEKASGGLFGAEELLMFPLFLERNLRMKRADALEHLKTWAWCYASNSLSEGK